MTSIGRANKVHKPKEIQSNQLSLPDLGDHNIRQGPLNTTIIKKKKKKKKQDKTRNYYELYNSLYLFLGQFFVKTFFFILCFTKKLAITLRVL